MLDSLESTWALTPCTYLPALLAVKGSVAVNSDRIGLRTRCSIDSFQSLPLVHCVTLMLCGSEQFVGNQVGGIISPFCTGYHLSSALPNWTSGLAHFYHTRAPDHVRSIFLSNEAPNFAPLILSCDRGGVLRLSRARHCALCLSSIRTTLRLPAPTFPLLLRRLL